MRRAFKDFPRGPVSRRRAIPRQRATCRLIPIPFAVITYHLLTGGHHPYGSAWAGAKHPTDFYTLTYHPAANYNPMVPLWMDAVLRKALSIRIESRQEAMSEFLHQLRHPDPSLMAVERLPFAQRNPLLFWKLVSCFAFLGWMITWVILS